MPITSYGIACCRKNISGQYELLMIRKRCTYSFSEFIRGIYDVNRKQDLIYLFDNMTIEEKVLIRIKIFDVLWIRNFGEPPNKEKNSYIKSTKKFNALVKINEGKYLDEIISASSNVELLWEIPKGRSDKREMPIESAIREFKEETDIPKDYYRILFDEGYVTYTFMDSGIRYTYIYYIAIVNNNRIIPKYAYDSSHMPKEVSNVQFLSTDKIKLMNNNRLYKLAKSIICKVKRHI